MKVIAIKVVSVVVMVIVAMVVVPLNTFNKDCDMMLSTVNVPGYCQLCYNLWACDAPIRHNNCLHQFCNSNHKLKDHFNSFYFSRNNGGNKFSIIYFKSIVAIMNKSSIYIHTFDKGIELY